MTRFHTMGSAVSGALSNAMVALTPLLIFQAEQAGQFAVVYLIFALAWSLTLSIVCDAWVRERAVLEPARNAWHNYSPASMQLSLLSGVVGLLVGWAVYGSPVIAIAAAIGIAANVSRLGGRYYKVVIHGPVAVLASDAATIVVFVLVLSAAAFSGTDMSLGLTLAWAVSNLVGTIFYPPTAWHRNNTLAVWIRERRHAVALLLKDSVLMDAGANLAPLAMMPLMGAAGFGIYRAVSSVATPVQLLLDPLRPNISQLPTTVVRGRSTLMAVLVAAAAMSGAAYGVLVVVIRGWGLFPGVLTDLAGYALPSAVFVAANLVGHFYYICARARLQQRAILTGRIFQTAVSIIFPLAGLLAFQLGGAIWGFSLAAACSGTLWLILVRREGDPAREATQDSLETDAKGA